MTRSHAEVVDRDRQIRVALRNLGHEAKSVEDIEAGQAAEPIGNFAGSEVMLDSADFRFAVTCRPRRLLRQPLNPKRDLKRRRR